jgi:hypothetical protein
MRNIDTTWKALAPGMALADRYERELEARWREPLRHERDRRDRDARATWEAEEAERVRKHDVAVAAREAREIARLERVAEDRAAWAERVRSARARLGRWARSSAAVGAPALLIALAVTALAGGDAVLVAVVALLAASPALLAGLSLVAVRLSDPAWRSRPESMVKELEPAPIPGPEPEPPVDLGIVEQWWQELAIPQAPPRSFEEGDSDDEGDPGDAGVDLFFEGLEELPDDYIAMRELIVRRGLDVDAIVLGPTGLWLFEIKYWRGEVICRDGQWEQIKYDKYDNRHSRDHGRVDRQWLREVDAVEQTLDRRLSRKVWVPPASGGIVFSFPGVEWDIDDSCQAAYGNVPYWVDEIGKPSEIEDFPLASQLAILDALVKWAHRLDDGLAECENDAVALAKRLYHEVVAEATDYVAVSEGITS